MLPVEVRYLDIVWSDPETVLKLEPSREALDIEQTGLCWQVETTTFPHANHFIGFKVLEPDVLHPLYFVLADGQPEELKSFKDPGSDDVWWIQNNGWDSQKKRYLSDLYRTTGRAELKVQQQLLTIENNTFNFTVAELEHYLADFKNNLWMLILDDKSSAKAHVHKEIPSCFNEDALQFFTEFINSAEKITKKPSMVLSETQRKVPLRSVRPVPRTFREYATRPDAKLLTSRVFYESYDTAENRFIHFCVKRILYILNRLLLVSNAQQDSYLQKITQENEYVNMLENMTNKKVDYKVYDNEIYDVEKQYNDFIFSLCFLIDINISPDYNEDNYFVSGGYSFTLGGGYGNKKNQYFANDLNGKSFRENYNELGSYLIVTLPFSNDFNAFYKRINNCSISIIGDFCQRSALTQNGKKYYEFFCCKIKSISIISSPLQIKANSMKDNRLILERNNWIANLTRDEIKDRDNEIAVTRKKLANYKIQQNQMLSFSRSALLLQKRLSKVFLFFKVNKIKKRSDCPNTMVFIQNPSYASAKKKFKDISGLSGFNDFIIESLMVIDKIGLVNVANLYEKWCLIQIIKVLVDVYQFDIKDKWQHDLISAVLLNKFDIVLSFHADSRQQIINLTYEKVLASGKRPDFVIDLTSKEYEFKTGNSSVWIAKGNKEKRLVLDAKFRGLISEKRLNKLVYELYTEKNYSEDGTNQVFIIHPSPNVIERKTSPLVWGEHSDYGQTLESQHRYGSVFLSPSLKYARSFDHLQRLIGMFLQSNSVLLRSALLQDQQNSADWHNFNCISCGNSDINEIKDFYKPTKKGSERWEITCNVCTSFTVKTVCFSCAKPLYKNGPKWTYHRTLAEQTSNVICPYCEEFL